MLFFGKNLLGTRPNLELSLENRPVEQNPKIMVDYFLSGALRCKHFLSGKMCACTRNSSTFASEKTCLEVT